MKTIAKILIYSIQYLGNDRNDEEYTTDDDLKIVEMAAALLEEASDEEKDLLKNVSKELGLNDWASQIGIE
ncbi:MAG: hypothetical protein KGV56_04150 [Gammaproteobacteria bacterium]|nr:hypothetical protein [Gammaproteobacteria bacterium]